MALVAEPMAAAPTAAAPASAAAEASTVATPALVPGARWTLVSQTVHVHVDLRQAMLRGTVILNVRLPAKGQHLTELRLHCASTCAVQRCLLDGLPVTPTAPADADHTDEEIVPTRWRHTRDFASYQRCHGAATFLGSYQFWDEHASGRCFHGGQFAVPLPSASAGKQGEVVSLQIEYIVSEPRGGVHFVRRHGGATAEVAYAHTVGEAGAARRWMPCVDCVQVRCPVHLHVTADAALQVHASGRPISDGTSDAVPSLATTAGVPVRTWSFAHDHPVTASQVGFVVGHLSIMPHPAMPNVTLAVGTLAPADAARAGDAAHDKLWSQMLYLSRQLPSLFQFLRSHLLGPSAAVVAEAALAAEDAAAAAAVRRVGEGAQRQPPLLRHHPSQLLQATAWSGGVKAEGGEVAGGEEEGDGGHALSDPFVHHTIVALEGSFEETAAFAGLVLLSAHLLHPPGVLEPARPLRLALGRAVGRSWLMSGVWLAGWRDAWLLLALEGRLVHGLVEHEFGGDEANHRLSEERRELCRTSSGESNVALVPDERELGQWGGGLHPEQLFCAHRQRKAPLVFRMLESAVVRTDGGRKAFTRLLARLMIFPPPKTSAPDRLRSTEGMLAACVAAGAKLGTLDSEWIFSAKPCPTLRANFAFNHSQHKVELVLVQPPASEAAQLGEMPLTVGWGEPDGDDAVARTTMPPIRINPVERHQRVELTVSIHRRRRRKRKRGAATGGDGGDDGDDDGDEGRAGVGSGDPLLWVRIDPNMELPLRVLWTGRADEPCWNGLPETMCAGQLVHDRHVSSRVEAATSLTTFKTPTAIDALSRCLRDAGAYFRVRTAAAMALGVMVDSATDLAAVRELIRHVRDRHFEAGSRRPNDFSDLGEYAVLKACVEAIGTCRDGGGRTPPAAFELLLELLDENDNTSNDFADDYFVSALLRALAATHTILPGALHTIVKQITRCLRLDSARPTHERVLTRASLQALVTIDLERSRRANEVRRTAAEDAAAGNAGAGDEDGGVHDKDEGLVTASWSTYWHCEVHGECAALRLTAADCLLRLSLLLAPEDIPHDECRPVLALAHRLAEARVHAPLEQLWLWTALLALLSEPLHKAAVERERERLNARGDSKAVAAVELLWYGMTEGTTGHARLRYVQCEVWRRLIGEEHQPGCLPFAPQPIGHEQLGGIPSGFVPLHTMRRTRREAADTRRAALMPKAMFKTRMYRDKLTGALTHNDTSAGDVRLPADVSFVCPSADLEQLPALEDEYRTRAERKWVTFQNLVEAVAPAAAAPPGGYGAYGVPPSS